jgi:pyruvate/2-oxoglutarate dehydrogenase complex dihydrolipoamide dehydrogenase (E3) component
MQAKGITVRTGISATKVARENSGGPVTVTLADGSEVTADEILVAVGRRPNTNDLALDKVGLEPGGFVDVDESMRSTHEQNDWLYAIGDANGRALLTHVGKYQARIAADAILGRPGAVVEERAIPRVTFTHPQVAAVGLTHAEAADQGIHARSVTTDISEVAGSSVTGVGVSGKVQLTFDGDRDVIVGATFTGPAVADMLHAATIAIVAEITTDRLKHAVPSFPTVSEVWLKLMESYESESAGS